MAALLCAVLLGVLLLVIRWSLLLLGLTGVLSRRKGRGCQQVASVGGSAGTNAAGTAIDSCVMSSPA
jgi:hypothetical protein